MGILGVIGRILALLAAVVLCLPVVLLPISTLVPAWVWIPLGVSDLVLIFLQFHLKPAWRGIALNLGIGLVKLDCDRRFAIFHKNSTDYR